MSKSKDAMPGSQQQEVVRWRVTRIVKEVMEVHASTRQEAIETANNPHSVTVIKETAVRAHE